MPFPMRIQPVDSIRNDVVKPPKSRLKRLFDRPFSRVSSTAEKPDKEAEFEPSSVCLGNMVQNFIEDNNNDKQHSKYGGNRNNRCNCFNGNGNDSSDDDEDYELDFFSDNSSVVATTLNSSFGDPSDALKSLVLCASTLQRNLLADTSKIVEKNNNSNKNCSKRKDDLRRIVADGLIGLGYNASVCRSKWDKSSSIPAGEYEYIDVIQEGDRVLIDVDFRSEFEIARSTGSYKAVLQCLPHIFVGKPDRLVQIISIVSEAARQSLKKKGMHIAPWRKPEYIKSKWLAPHTRNDTTIDKPTTEPGDHQEVMECEVGELDLIFGEETVSSEPVSEMGTWQLPAVKPKSLERRNSNKVVTGLASLLKEKL